MLILEIKIVEIIVKLQIHIIMTVSWFIVCLSFCNRSNELYNTVALVACLMVQQKKRFFAQW